jgi:acetyl esterase/lipase
MDMDLAYANGAFIKGAEDYVPRWEAKAAAFRAGLGPQAQTHSYGTGARHQFDLFLPASTPRGSVTFIHGGYWLASDRSQWSHLAAGVLAQGWACAMPSYTLAPQARITEMTAEMVAALTAIGQHVAGPMVVTGHSAGGHLAARMGCDDITLPRLARVVPMSPLSDLEQIAQTKMQDSLHLDATEIAAQSPARLTLRTGVQAHVWVGGQERPSFLWQARLLSEAWDCPWTVSPDQHHFNVIDALEDPTSPLVTTLINGL